LANFHSKAVSSDSKSSPRSSN